ncbi:hypothetical protein AZ66_16065 [Paenibacillus sp. E194]|nr:hypothetical protein AZ66_16065 [Paenibacillus sp. E194]
MIHDRIILSLVISVNRYMLLDNNGAEIDPKVTHEEITKSVVDYIKKNNLHNISWWARAFGGTIIAKVTEQLWIRVGRRNVLKVEIISDMS